MKRDLVYTTDDLPPPPFDPTRVYAPATHENHRSVASVEKVGLGSGLDQLAPGKFGKHAGSTAELFESSHLDDLATYKQDNPVSALNGAESVGDDEACQVELGK